MGYEKYLPKPSAKPGGIMIRPGNETAAKLEILAGQHGCSVNALCIALIKAQLDATTPPPSEEAASIERCYTLWDVRKKLKDKAEAARNEPHGNPKENPCAACWVGEK